MQAHYFLFVLAFIWTLVATIQDLKSREVANWLNFSLITFALSYRAFYATRFANPQFFFLGLLGLIIFIALGYALYYAKAFAGGDAKLMMGFGIILPYQGYFDLVLLATIFLIALFLIGAIYSLIYSFFLIFKNKKQFAKEFTNNLTKNKWLALLSLALSLISLVAATLIPFATLFSILFLLPFIWMYSKSLDKCMIKRYSPDKITEGDWLEKEVRIGNTVIKKSVHGLSKKDIALIKKHNKSVYVKEGIPFVPAFLITLILMVYAALSSQLQNLLSFFSPQFFLALF